MLFQFFSILLCFICTTTISDSIAQHDIAVIDHPAVTCFDCGFIVNTDDFSRDDHIVMTSIEIIRLFLCLNQIIYYFYFLPVNNQ